MTNTIRPHTDVNREAEKTRKLFGMIGLATRAGRVAFGSEMSVDAARRGHAAVVILAEDASCRTKKLILNKCKSFQVDFFECGSKESLGHACGKNRVSALAILDKGFAKAIMKIYCNLLNTNYII